MNKLSNWCDFFYKISVILPPRFENIMPDIPENPVYFPNENKQTIRPEKYNKDPLETSQTMPAEPYIDAERPSIPRPPIVPRGFALTDLPPSSAVIPIVLDDAGSFRTSNNSHLYSDIGELVFPKEDIQQAIEKAKRDFNYFGPKSK